MTLQALIDRLQSIANNGHAQEEVCFTDFVTRKDIPIMCAAPRARKLHMGEPLVHDVALYAEMYIV